MDQSLTLEQIREHGAPRTEDIPIEGLGIVKMREPTGTVVLEVEGKADTDAGPVWQSYRMLAKVAVNPDESLMFDGPKQVETLFGQVGAAIMTRLMRAATKFISGDTAADEAGK